MSIPEVDDVPSGPGLLSSPALRRRLEREDLVDLEVVLRYRGVRTLRALASLDTNERAVLLSKARQLWDLLGIFPSNLKSSLNKLFDAEGLPVGASTSSSAGRAPLEPGRVEGENSASSSSSSVVANVPADIPTLPVISELPIFCEDDSNLTKSLPAALAGARAIIGHERYNEVIRRLLISDQNSAASAIEASEALALLRVPKDELRDRETKALLKAAKLAVRNIVVWRCCGCAKGLDSREAMVRAFEVATMGTDNDINVVSQLKNGYRSIMMGLFGLEETRTQRRGMQRVGSPAPRLGCEG